MAMPPPSPSSADQSIPDPPPSAVDTNIARPAMPGALIRRNLVITIISLVLAFCLTACLAGGVWWILSPPVGQIIAYALGLLLLSVLVAGLALLVVNQRPGVRVAVVTATASLLLMCVAVPAGTFYAFAVNHEPPGDPSFEGALDEYLVAEYGYFGDAPQSVVAERYACSKADGQAILAELGEIAPKQVRVYMDSRGFSDTTVRYRWESVDGKRPVLAGNRVTVWRVLEIATSRWVTPGPDDWRTNPYLADARALYDAEFGLRKNSADRWCVYSGKNLGSRS